LGPKPLLAAHPDSRILIIGQAPGQATHLKGIPWSDRSGDTLRRWLDTSMEDFYNPRHIALLPMGFCYPGTGKSGDFEPRPECAPMWHPKILPQLKQLRLTIYLGRFALGHYFGERFPNLTAGVKAFKDLLPKQLILPHPSPRNGPWLKQNPWFEKSLLPYLRDRVQQALRNT
jgi:uracil-DNA glycosylase